jgi:zinc transport system substrate-binding protein
MPGSIPITPRSSSSESSRPSAPGTRSTPPAFKANAAALAAKLDALASELDGDLKPVADKPYIVFHDAFQYLERRYGLNVVGSISINPECRRAPSGSPTCAARSSRYARCACFAEPAFDRRLVDNLIEGTSARTGTLDAEGSSLDPGPELYFALMRKLAGAIEGLPRRRGLRG